MTIVTVCIMLLLLAGWIFSTGPRDRSLPRISCRNNLKQLGTALHNYAHTYGSFPPAYVTDETGRAMHSWRVLLLPYLDQESLYEQYRFDEPWDGPHNRLLADRIVDVFNCPQGTGGPVPSTETSYVAVVGPRTAWPDAHARPFSEIVDGLSNTVLVVEMHNSGIRWTEPRDLELNDMSFQINAPIRRAIASTHDVGANFLFADGHVSWVPETLSADELRSLLIVDDGAPSGFAY